MSSDLNSSLLDLRGSVEMEMYLRTEKMYVLSGLTTHTDHVRHIEVTA